MNEMKHTPGPWMVVRGGAHSPWTVSPVLKWNAFSNPAKEDVVLANARLIAAAPDLLDALKAVHALLPEDIRANVELLIARAEGGASRKVEA